MHATVERMKKEGQPVSPNVEKLLASGEELLVHDDANSAAAVARTSICHQRGYKPVKVSEGVWSVAVAKKSNGVVKKNAGASLIDLGDGVGCIEFHSKMNAIGGDIVQLIQQSLKPGGPGDATSTRSSSPTTRTNFSVGANIMLLLMAVQEEEWDEVDMMIRGFQGMTQLIKFSPKPVVAAPFGMTLGGGCEVALHAPRSPATCGTLHGTRRSRRRPAARRRRLQRDDAARRRCRHFDSSRWARRIGRTDGSHEEGIRNHRHGEGFDLGVRGAQISASFSGRTTSP